MPDRSHDRPFRFGVTADRTGDAAAWTATARRAETLGYDVLLLPDTVRTAAPMPALAAAAAATSTLHVGTWVVCSPLRPPRVLAWEARTMQDLFGARVELGIGAGRPGAEQDADLLGVPYGSPGERVDQLAATVELLREQVPGLSLLVAASGPRLLRFAGRAADTVALGWPPETDLATARERTRVVIDAASARDEPPALAAGLIAVGETGAPWLARMGTSVDELAAAGAVTVLTGSTTQMADTLRQRRDELGIAYWTVPVGAAEAFAPVVDELRA